MASRAVIISGAGGGGIGTAIATQFRTSGHAVFSIERTEEARQYLLSVVDCPPENVVLGDVGSEADVMRLAARVLESGYSVSSVVHNAARGSRPSAVSGVSLEEFNQDLSDILVGGFLLAKHFSGMLMRNAPSSMVFVSSSAATRGARGRGPSYAAAKAGLHGLTVSLALELAPSGVTVNAVAPTQTVTPRVLRDGRRTEAEITRRALEGVPVGRAAVPGDIAAVVEFLCSGGARYITGKVIEVDGGQFLAPRWTESE